VKNKLSLLNILIISIVLSLNLSSCSKPKLDDESLIGLKSYFDSIENNDYKNAYLKLHPLLRKKITLDEYIENLKNTQYKDGDILAVKFDGIVKHVEGDYVYSVTLIRERKIAKYNMEMLKEEDGLWYLNAVKGISEKKREP